MSSDKTRVLVLFGGRSAEHEISIISARFIVQSLDRSRFTPVLVGIDKRGCWTLQQEEILLAKSGDPRAVAIDEAGPGVVLPPMPAPAAAGIAAVLRDADGGEHPVDVAFPILHGPMGEDGCMQGLFELAQLPYVGAGVLGCALGMDKALQRRVLEQAELPVVPSITVRRHEWDSDRDSTPATAAPAATATHEQVVSDCERLGYPLFVKPANMGSSLGISRAGSLRELRTAMAHAFEFDTKVVVERGLDAPREIECAVLGNDHPQASVPGEIAVSHRDGFYSYDAKYIDPDGAALLIPAKLHRQEVTAVQLLALRAFRALDCAGMARVDLFMTAERDIFINEINTIPGFTAISMYPQLWAHSGVGSTALVSRLIDLGIERHRARAKLRTTR